MMVRSNGSTSPRLPAAPHAALTKNAAIPVPSAPCRVSAKDMATPACFAAARKDEFDTVPEFCMTEATMWHSRAADIWETLRAPMWRHRSATAAPSSPCVTIVAACLEYTWQMAAVTSPTGSASHIRCASGVVLPSCTGGDSSSPAVEPACITYGNEAGLSYSQREARTRQRGTDATRPPSVVMGADRLQRHTHQPAHPTCYPVGHAEM